MRISEEIIKETFFITHGNPILTVEDTHSLRPFFEQWKERVYKTNPKAILIISGHWETDYPSVNSVNVNDTIHDFDDYPPPMYQNWKERVYTTKPKAILIISGHCETDHPAVNAVDVNDPIHHFDNYPAPMYQMKYPAPGAPKLALRVQEMLKKSGYERVDVDQKRGLDHGAWVPLMYMYPEAEIPVCQLSVQPQLDGTYHYNLGRALAPLKDEGVLIIGSGSATHPLDETPHFHGGVAPWAAAFELWLQTALFNGRHEEVKTYETKAPNWELAHPFPEHFYPLHVVLGAAGDNLKADLIHTGWDHGTLSHSAYRFSSA